MPGPDGAALCIRFLIRPRPSSRAGQGRGVAPARSGAKRRLAAALDAPERAMANASGQSFLLLEALTDMSAGRQLARRLDAFPLPADAGSRTLAMPC